MYKSGILIAALVSVVYASENPFAIEKNIQKIEQDENALLQAVVKEQKNLKKKEDERFKEGIPKTKTSSMKPKESSVPSETKIVQEHEVRETEKEIKKEIRKSNLEEVAPPKEETKELIIIEKVTKIAEIEMASQPEEAKVDAKIKKPEEKHKANEIKSAIENKVPMQSDAETKDLAESNSTFEQRLQEAIRSVR